MIISYPLSAQTTPTHHTTPTLLIAALASPIASLSKPLTSTIRLFFLSSPPPPLCCCGFSSLMADPVNPKSSKELLLRRGVDTEV